MARVKKNIEFSPGLIVEVLRMTLTDKTAVDAVTKFFNTDLTTSGTFGNGLMTYSGNYNDDRSLFLGTNSKLGMSIVVFINSPGMALFERFRNDFLNLSNNKPLVEKMSVSSLEATFVTYKPSDIRVADDFQNKVEEIVVKQQKTIPKLDLNKGVLYIGGRTGNTSLSLQSVVLGDLSVKYVATRLKLKDKSAQQFFSILNQSLESTTNAVVAYFMLEQLKRTVLTELTTDLRNRLIKEYDLAKVITTAQTKSRATTSSGKFILRALSGVLNKLRGEETRGESGSLLVEWFLKLSNNNDTVRKDSLKVKDLKILLKQILDILLPLYPGVRPPIPPGATPTLSRNVTAGAGAAAKAKAKTPPAAAAKTPSPEGTQTASTGAADGTVVDPAPEVGDTTLEGGDQ